MNTPEMQPQAQTKAAIADSVQRPCYAAAWIVHTPSGPVPACESHAGKIQSLMNFMGAYTNKTPALEGEQCSNCINESKRHNA